MFKPRKKKSEKKTSTRDDGSKHPEEPSVEETSESSQTLVEPGRSTSGKTAEPSDPRDGGDATKSEESAGDSAGRDAGADGRDGEDADSDADSASEVEPAEPAPPLEGVGWKVTASRDLSTALLDFERVEDAEQPTAGMILDAAIYLGVPGDVLFETATLERALANATNSGIPLRSYAITEDRDAEFSIDLSDDKLKAVLNVHKGCGRGAPLDLKAVGTAIRESGLKGMDFEKIKKDILEFYRGADFVLEKYELAAGTKAEDGALREITWEIEMLSDSRIETLKRHADEAPAEAFKEIESIDEMPIRDIEEMAMVGEESIVASLSKQDPGKPGMDAFGKIIAPKPGQIPPIRILEHLRLGQDTIIAECDGVLERWNDEAQGLSVRVRPHRDAASAVKISADNMMASVVLTEGSGSGTRLSVELVRQSLIDAGVIKGIDLDAIGTAIEQTKNLPSSGETVVARGQAPIESGESRIKFKVELASGKGVTIRPDGTADFKNQDRITTVEEGQLIAEVAGEEIEIQDGFDVKSNVIKAKESGDLEIEIGEGIRKDHDEKGTLLLIADSAGELLYDGRALAIGEIRTVQSDVGAPTGNVKFAGSVNITGSVLTGFFVMSKGSIKIAENVEASLVSADESIHIQLGVKGAGKAVLRARQEITAMFIEQATVMSVGNTTIQNTCLHSNIKCNGKLVLATDKGRLVGGQTRARNGVVATQIGTPRGVHTEISFGQDYLIGDKIELEEREIEKLKKALVQLEGKIHAAERELSNRDVEKGRAKKVQALKLIEKRTERLFWLRERFEQHFDSAVEVRGTIYPGVILESHGRALEITYEKRNVIFRFNADSGHIEEIERKDQKP